MNDGNQLTVHTIAPSGFSLSHPRTRRDLLARVPFPPDRTNSDVRAGNHGLLARNTSSIQHGLKDWVNLWSLPVDSSSRSELT